MRALGAALVLLGAAGGYLLRRREQLLPVRLGRALLEDLAVLDYQIRFRRRKNSGRKTRKRKGLEADKTGR